MLLYTEKNNFTNLYKFVSLKSELWNLFYKHDLDLARQLAILQILWTCLRFEFHDPFYKGKVATNLGRQIRIKENGRESKSTRVTREEKPAAHYPHYTRESRNASVKNRSFPN
jgi:hypothetical protein